MERLDQTHDPRWSAANGPSVGPEQVELYNNEIQWNYEMYASYMYTELEYIKNFSWEPKYVFTRYLKVLCIETSSSLGSLLKFEGAAGEIKGPLISWLQMIGALSIQETLAYGFLICEYSARAI